jgi:hypothetical protein
MVGVGHGRFALPHGLVGVEVAPVKYAARIDSNQPAIVNALRAVGATVQPIHTVGKGCPDLLCARHGQVYVLEVKDGRLPPSKRRLTPDEQAWHDMWDGPVYIVGSVEEALAAIGAEVRIE